MFSVRRGAIMLFLCREGGENFLIQIFFDMFQASQIDKIISRGLTTIFVFNKNIIE